MPRFPFLKTASSGLFIIFLIIFIFAFSTFAEAQVLFSKSFTDDPVVPGGTVTLQFSITNTNSTESMTDIGFTDDLDATLSGLLATGLPQNDVCGVGSGLSGAGLITLNGGTLAPSSSCTFSVTLQVPATVTVGTYPNTTSNIIGNAGGTPFVGSQASDDLYIESPPHFFKTFAPNTISQGGVSTLTFTIDNTANTQPATALDFTDNLPAALSIATVPNASTTCTGGTLTAVSGTGTVSYTGGTVDAGAVCTVSADVTADASATGTLVNTSGDLTSSLGNSGPASDTLDISPTPPPLFSKTFTPGTINVGEVSTITYTINNTGNSIDATSLGFTDNLPAEIEVSSTPNASSTCSGGTLTATAGSSSISYSGGAVPAGGTCTVTADIIANASGFHASTTGDLTSNLGNSGTAGATLTAHGPSVPALGEKGALLMAVLLAAALLYTFKRRRRA